MSLVRAILVISLFATLLFLSISVGSADAKKSEGNYNSRVGVDICGDRLCESGEELTTQEKLGFYLLALIEVEVPDDVMQQSIYGMPMSPGQNPTGSFISQGQFNFQFVPTFTAGSLSSVAPSVTDMAPIAVAPSVTAKAPISAAPIAAAPSTSFSVPAIAPSKSFSAPFSVAPSTSFTVREFSPIVIKGFDSSVRSVANLIDRTDIFSGKIDISKIRPSVKLGNPYVFDKIAMMHIKIAQEEEKKYTITALPKVQLESYASKKIFELANPEMINMAKFVPSFRFADELLSSYSLVYVILDEPLLGSLADADSVVVSSELRPQNSFTYNLRQAIEGQGYNLQACSSTEYDQCIEDIFKDGRYFVEFIAWQLGAIGHDTYHAEYVDSLGVTRMASTEVIGAGAPEGVYMEQPEMTTTTLDYKPKMIYSFDTNEYEDYWGNISPAKIKVNIENQDGVKCTSHLSPDTNAVIDVFTQPTQIYTSKTSGSLCGGGGSSSHSLNWPGFQVGDVITFTPYQKLCIRDGGCTVSASEDYYEYTYYPEFSKTLTIDAEFLVSQAGDPNQLPTIEFSSDSFPSDAEVNKPELTVTAFGANTDVTSWQSVKIEYTWPGNVETYDQSIPKWNSLNIVETEVNSGIFSQQLSQNMFRDLHNQYPFAGDIITFRLVDIHGVWGTPDEIVVTTTLDVS